MRRRVASIERGEQRHRIDGLVACEAACEVDLVAVTGADVLEDRHHTLLERDAIEARMPARERRRGGRVGTIARRFGRLREQAACFAVPVELTPSRRRVEHEPSGEARENEVGEGRFVIATVRSRTWRYLLDRTAELVGQEPRPPPGWEPVERCERVRAGCHAQGIRRRGDDEPGAVPHDGGVDGCGEGGEQRGGARRGTGGHLRPGGGHARRVAAPRAAPSVFRATEESTPSPVA